MTTPTAFAHHPNVTRTTTSLPAIATPDATNATQALIERLEAHLTPPGPTQDPDWYGWIPLRHAVFLAGLLQARHILNRQASAIRQTSTETVNQNDGRYQFLDVGSGIGTKLIIAHELGYHPHGIERWSPYVDVSRTIAPFAEVVTASATDPPGGYYSRYDLIHYYGCSPDQAKDGAIKDRVTTHMKPGALFFTTRRPFPTGMQHVAQFLWRKPAAD